MLIGITMTLRAVGGGVLPRDVGRANYSGVLTRLGEVDAGLDVAVHDGHGPKPLTCSGLLNAKSSRAGTAVQAGKAYYVRMTGLTERVSQALEAAFVDDGPTAWTLLGQEFAVEEVVCDAAANPWSGRDQYEALAAQNLLASGRVERAVSLRFASPTSFKQTMPAVDREVHMPIPLPGLVFGSLVDRWNAFSSVAVGSEMRRFADEVMVISSYSLSSRPVVQNAGSLRVGGVGQVTYRALGGDRYWVGVMQMLAEFAKYSGVGILTTAGMGQVRRVGAEKRSGEGDKVKG